MVWSIVVFVLMVYAIMHMWRRRRYGTPVPPTSDPAFDKAEGHPQAAEATELLRTGAWPQLTLLYGRLPASDRYHLVQGMGELASSEPASWPDSADSAIMTIRAGMKVTRAWNAATAGITKRVNAREHVTGVLRELEEAQKLLTEAAYRNPHDSVTFAIQLRIETYANGSTSDVNALTGKIDATEEANIFAALNHLIYASPKWHGSIEKMWAVANDYGSRGPNAAWLAIAARAHIEEWLFCMKIDTSQTADYVAKLQDTGFAQHVRGMDRQFWQRAAQGGMTRAEAHFAHNNFAFLLQVLRLDDLVGRHLEEIGPYISTQPWNFLPDGAERPTRLLGELRKRAGLEALATT